MPLTQIIVTIVIVGVVLYLVNTYIPMAKPIQVVLNVVVAIFLCQWLLSLFRVGDIYVGRHR